MAVPTWHCEHPCAGRRAGNRAYAREYGDRAGEGESNVGDATAYPAPSRRLAKPLGLQGVDAARRSPLRAVQALGAMAHPRQAKREE